MTSFRIISSDRFNYRIQEPFSDADSENRFQLPFPVRDFEWSILPGRIEISAEIFRHSRTGPEKLRNKHLATEVFPESNSGRGGKMLVQTRFPSIRSYRPRFESWLLRQTDILVALW